MLLNSLNKSKNIPKLCKCLSISTCTSAMQIEIERKFLLNSDIEFINLLETKYGAKLK
eukprot:Pgem_evm1s11836